MANTVTPHSAASPNPTPKTDHQETFQVHFPPNTTFTLTSTMLQHDAPSMFSRVFLSNSLFHETTSRTITITDKSPDLFQFILDYLRGYTIFPLVESAVPPKWLPLHKTYDNLRRDAAYYGLLRFEIECNKWFKRLVDPADRQAVLKLDFAPFIPGQRLLASHPFTAELVLDCHLADFPLLRRRFLKTGSKTLTYGPLPWKQIFEQIRDPCDRDGVLQSDGSSIVEVNSVFLKPPHSNESVLDDRKTEFAKIQLSKAVTQLILDNTKPGGLNSHPTIRFHTIDTTTIVRFLPSDSPSDPPASAPIASGQFLFSDKLQSDAYLNLRNIVKAVELDTVVTNEKKVLDENSVPFDADGEIALEVDGAKVNWGTLCQWSRIHSLFYKNKSWREIREVQEFVGGTDSRRHHSLFGGNRDSTTGAAIVPPSPPHSFFLFRSVADSEASIYGSAVFSFAKTRFDPYLVPQVISIRGLSSCEWERRRPIWEGDNSRERDPPRKRARTNKDGPDDGVEGRLVGGEQAIVDS